MAETEEIKQLYSDLCEASITKDINILNKVLADDYTLVHMTGLIQTKEDYIKSVISGQLKYYKSIHESIDVKIDGNKASITGKTKTLASPFGMTKSWWYLKQDITLEKINNKWIIKHSIASTY
ncbi:MAG: nuclear transport factor 2 family protein [Bacilli bacterium]|nr:nuclear transport factor 2 family protein [Bacilli bacterium]